MREGFGSLPKEGVVLGSSVKPFVALFQALPWRGALTLASSITLTLLLLSAAFANQPEAPDATPAQNPLAEDKSLAFTPSEKEWIAHHPEVRFTGDPNWLPYEAFKEDGTYIGIVADHLKLIEAKSGLRFKTVPVSSWTESLDIATEGGVAVISGDSADAILNQRFDPVDTYSQNPIVIIMDFKQNYIEDLEVIKDKKIAIIKNYGYTADLFRIYPDFNFIEVENIQAGLEGVSQGRFDAMLATMALASYNIAGMGIHNVKVVGKTSIIMDLTLFVSKAEPVLKSIINKSLKSISVAESQDILQNWIRSKYIEKTDYSILWKVSLGLLGIILISLAWIRRLQKEVDRRRSAEQALQESRSLLEEAQGMAHVGNWVLDPQTMKATWSEEVYRIFGIDYREDVGPEFLSTILHPEDRESVLCSLQQATEATHHHQMEYRIHRPDGEVRWLNCQADHVRDETGNVKYLRGVIQDVTQRKSHELALQQSEAHFKALAEAGFEAIFISEQAQCLSQNLAAEKMFGYSLEEATGKPGKEWFAESSQALVKHNMLSGYEEAYEATGKRKDGSEFPLLVRGKMINYQDREVRVTAILDLTQQKKTERILRESETRFRQLFEETDGIAVQGYDASRSVFYWNSASEKLYGYTAKYAIGRQLEDLIIPDADRQQVIDNVQHWLESEQAMPSSELTLCKSDGSPVKVFSSHVMLKHQDREPEMYCVDIDLTQHKLIEDTLRASEAYLRALSEAIPDFIFVIDGSGVITKTNHAQPDHTSDELIGKKIIELLDKDYQKAFNDAFYIALTDRKLQTLELRVNLPDGPHDFLSRINPIKLPDKGSSLVLIATDITERKQAERSLRRTQKMDALGQLTGGIAHDFNNILGIILGNLNLLESQVTTNQKAHKRVIAIKKSAERAAKLTKQMLGFSRRQASEVSVTDINRTICEMESLISRSVTPKIEVSLQLTEDLWLAEIDSGELQDGLLNLIFNARDAMPYGGRLILATSNAVLDEHYCLKNRGARLGEYIKITVSDNGKGIPVEQQEHIFEPFFTTKTREKGTGLGLAMVFGFIKRSNGYIEVSSNTETGTSFYLYLPQAKGKVLPETISEEPEEALPQGSETILAVDDEEGLLELAQDSLEILGYRVFTAVDGQSALEILTSGERIDLLFSDVVMPGGVDGYELAELAAAQYPDLKILLTSGYTGKSTEERPSNASLTLLKKPYSQFQLAHRIRDLLGKSTETKPTAEPITPPMLIWSKEFCLGIDAMDQDHKTVFDILRRCRNALLANLKGEASASIDDLVSFSQTHFNREEAIMAACNYSRQANHQQVHQLLLNQAKKIRVTYQRGDTGTEDMIESLGSWWVDHIQAMDQAYAKEFQHKHELIEITLSQMENGDS